MNGQKFWIIMMVLSIIAAIFTILHRPRTAVTSAVIPGAIRYLPLGDSYTIGESVSENQRWPNQLASRLAQDGKKLQIVANPSVTGYTTQDLIDRELPLLPRLKPDFVTILIGVNDYVQGVDAQSFQQHLEYIVTTVQNQLAKPNNLVLITIPDYGKTPSGERFSNPQSAEAGVREFNQIITDTASEHKLAIADIFGVSQKVVSDPSLIASDGLHPSGKQYTDWTDVIYAALQSNKLPL